MKKVSPKRKYLRIKVRGWRLKLHNALDLLNFFTLKRNNLALEYINDITQGRVKNNFTQKKYLQVQCQYYSYTVNVYN